MRQWIVGNKNNENLYSVTGRIVERCYRPERVRITSAAKCNRITQIAAAIIVIAFSGCRVSGTIGGTTDLERSHNVNVAITFMGE
jgi:hypothetical protein